jgi:subtilisin family serine protease
MSSVNVAVLNADFDLNHASGNLPFGNPRHNVMDNNEQVDALKGHAHGTLCAGIIGARPGIDGWLSGGIEPASVMLPVAVYRTTDPVRAELGHLVEGIDAAVAQGCDVISISVEGFLVTNMLISAVADATAVGPSSSRERETGVRERTTVPISYR